MRKQRATDPEKEKYWRNVLARFQKSGLPFRKFCEQEKISANTFQFWRKELRQRDEDRGIRSSITVGENRPSDLKEKVQYWKQIIEDLNAYEGSISSYCKTHGVSSGSLHFWDKRLRDLNISDGVQAVRPIPKSMSPSTDEPKVDSNFARIEIVDALNEPKPKTRTEVEAADSACVLEIQLPNGIKLGLRETCSVDFLNSVMMTLGGVIQ